MELRDGTVLGDRFEIRKDLVTVGYGQVWEGFDQQLKRPIAIKRLLKKSFGKVDKSEVIEEAQRIAALNHPNIVSIYDVREYDDEVLIVMEFLPGGSLYDRLRTLSRQSRWISTASAVRLIREILSGLEAAHGWEGGAIIHRDLKPQNILFDRSDTSKIVDFGLAAVGEVKPLPTLDRGLLCEHEGTQGYKSPEQYRGLKLDTRTDLFNVGLIAYLVFASNHPFTDERFLFTHKEMVLEPYRPLLRIDESTLPPEIGKFVAKLLDEDPSRRFETATEALSEYEHIENTYNDLLVARCIRHHDAMVKDGTSPESIDSGDLAAGIMLLKQNSFYIPAKLLYERGGLDLSHLFPGELRRINEAYSFCCRRVEVGSMTV